MGETWGSGHWAWVVSLESNTSIDEYSLESLGIVKHKLPVRDDAAAEWSFPEIISTSIPQPSQKILSISRHKTAKALNASLLQITKSDNIAH